MSIIPSKDQTKTWRTKQHWYDNGRKTECEKYQITQIEKITKQKCCKTSARLHINKGIMREISHPYINEDGFEWTENFDAIVGQKYYFNFKMVCSAGGAQTRTLQQVYSFIKAQYKFLLKIKKLT
jgi:hypothetical protein